VQSPEGVLKKLGSSEKGLSSLRYNFYFSNVFSKFC